MGALPVILATMSTRLNRYAMSAPVAVKKSGSGVGVGVGAATWTVEAGVGCGALGAKVTIRATIRKAARTSSSTAPCSMRWRSFWIVASPRVGTGAGAGVGVMTGLR